MNRKSVLFALAAAALAGLGAAITLFALGGPGGSVTPETVQRVLETSESFPDVVATVNGQPISGRTLAYNVEIAKMNAGYPAGTKADPALVAQALNHLIDDELLIQAARDRGLWPTEEEVASLATNLERQTKDAPPDARQAAEVGYRLQGFTLDDIDSAPALLEMHARAMALARIQTQIEENAGPAGPATQEALKAAIASFVQELRRAADIQILIALPTG